MQKMLVEEITNKREAGAVAVTTTLGSDDKSPKVIIGGDFVDETVQSKELHFPSTILESQISKNGESLIRALDVVGSVTTLLVSLPAMIGVALLVKLSSSGRILYKQKRVGKNGRIFTLYKFRTMINNAEEHTGPVWATENDSRVTPIGTFLRRTRLDELPQLFNVLWGDMSLVGPRPERPYFVKRHKDLQGMRLAVKPGLTGLAQIRSYYNLKPGHKIKYDRLYIKKKSLLLNLFILSKTIPVIFTKKGW